MHPFVNSTQQNFRGHRHQNRKTLFCTYKLKVDRIVISVQNVWMWASVLSGDLPRLPTKCYIWIRKVVGKVASCNTGATVSLMEHPVTVQPSHMFLFIGCFLSFCVCYEELMLHAIRQTSQKRGIFLCMLCSFGNSLSLLGHVIPWHLSYTAMWCCTFSEHQLWPSEMLTTTITSLSPHCSAFLLQSLWAAAFKKLHETVLYFSASQSDSPDKLPHHTKGINYKNKNS